MDPFASGVARPRLRSRIRWPDSAAFLALCAIAIAAAISVAAVAPEPPTSPDDALYASQAARILHGRPLTGLEGDPTVARGPGYILVVAGVQLIGADWATAERVLGAGSLAIALLVVGLLAWLVAGPGAGVGAAILAAAPSVVMAFTRSGIDAFHLALLLVALLAGLWAARTGWSTASAVVSGTALGAAIVTKEAALVLVPWAIGWCASLPAGALAPALRWAFRQTGIALVVAFPWWVWVYLSADRLFPSQIAGTTAAAGVVALGAAALVLLVIGQVGLPERLAGLLGRLGHGDRWWLALAVSAAFAGFAILGFLASQPRFELVRRPSAAALFEAVGEVAQPVAVPLVAVAVVIGALVLARDERPALRGVLLAIVLSLGAVGVVVVKGWDPRSALLFGVLMNVVVAAAAAGLVAVLVPRAAAAARPALLIGVAAAFLVAGSASAVELSVIWHRALPPRAAADWDNAAVRQTAAYLRANAEPGATIVTGWLFGSALDAETDAAFRWRVQPTLQLRLGNPGEPLFEPTGTLFREFGTVPSVVPGDLIVVRRHPTEDYYVGLSAEMLAEILRDPTVRYLVLTGENEPQSTVTIRTSLDAWPGLRQVTEFVDGDATLVVYAVDPAVVKATSAPLQMDGPSFLGFLDDLARLRPDLPPKAALADLLQGRDLLIAPESEPAQQLLDGILLGP